MCAANSHAFKIVCGVSAFADYIHWNKIKWAETRIIFIAIFLSWNVHKTLIYKTELKMNMSKQAMCGKEGGGKKKKTKTNPQSIRL